MNTAVSIWSLSYFFTFFYIFLIFTGSVYLISNINDFTSYNALNNSQSFSSTEGLDLTYLFLSPLVLFYLLNYTWTGYSICLWFSHLTFGTSQLSITYLLLTSFTLIWLAYLSSFYYSSQEVYDFTLVLYSFFIWMVLLFFSNNLFTVIFFIEILSTTISLTIITSTFSSLYFYNNLGLSTHNYFNHSTPFAFMQTTIFFFWISLIASLGLFVFLTLFYLSMLSFDWFNLEYIFLYYIMSGDLKSYSTLSVVWLSFLFCLFLNCGLVPFFFWNPVFFKGIPLQGLFFYIVFFYFFLFLYFSLFLLVYLNELFYFNVYLNLTFSVLGMLFLLFILCESFYINAFLAMSSILNTLLLFLAFNSNLLMDSFLNI